MSDQTEFPSSGTIEFRTLGAIDLTAERAGDVLTHPKRTALLAYLAVAQPRGFHRRDELLALFWPELDAAHARNALSQVLHQVRKSLGADVIVTRGAAELAVDTRRLHCDAALFDRSVGEGRLEEALALYRGEFLHSFHLSGAPDFAHWADRQRLRFRHAALKAACRLAEQEEERGRLVAAGHWARRAGELAGDDEVAIRRLIDLLARIGDRAGAVRLYEEFTQRLASQLQVDPAPETRRAIAAVRGNDEPSASSQTPPPPLDAPHVPPRRHRLRIGLSAGVAVALAGASILLGHLWPGRAVPANPHRVFVARPENETGDTALDAVGQVVADWLTRELQATQLVQVVSERDLSAGSRGGRRSRALASDVGAGTVVSVTYYALGDSLRFQARLVEARTGTTLYATDFESTPIGIPLARLEQLGREVVDAVVTEVASGVEWPRAGRHPPTFVAYKEYMRGLALLGHLDFDGAIAAWFSAAHLDTAFVTPLLAAGSFMLVAGEDASADSLVSMIERRQAGLSVPEQRRLENLSARLRGDLPRALAALRPVAEQDPVSEAGWELPLHELWLNQPRKAIAGFARMDPSWDLLRGWWFYWVFYADADHMVGDYEAELALANQGLSQYPGSHRIAECAIAALAALQRFDELDAVVTQIGTMPLELPGDQLRTLMVAAEELRAHGSGERAAALLDRWNPTHLGALTDSTAAPPLLMAMFAYESGLWDEARSRFARLAAEDSTDVNVQGYLGVIAARQGERREALRISAWLGRLGRPYLFGQNTLWRARISALLGDREGAIALLRRAFRSGLKFVGTYRQDAASRTFGPWLHRDGDLASLRSLPQFRQLLESP